MNDHVESSCHLLECFDDECFNDRYKAAKIIKDGLQGRWITIPVLNTTMADLATSVVAEVNALSEKLADCENTIKLLSIGIRQGDEIIEGLRGSH